MTYSIHVATLMIVTLALLVIFLRLSARETANFDQFHSIKSFNFTLPIQNLMFAQLLYILLLILVIFEYESFITKGSDCTRFDLRAFKFQKF